MGCNVGAKVGPSAEPRAVSCSSVGSEAFASPGLCSGSGFSPVSRRGRVEGRFEGWHYPGLTEKTHWANPMWKGLPIPLLFLQSHPGDSPLRCIGPLLEVVPPHSASRGRGAPFLNLSSRPKTQQYYTWRLCLRRRQFPAKRLVVRRCRRVGQRIHMRLAWLANRP